MRVSFDETIHEPCTQDQSTKIQTIRGSVSHTLYGVWSPGHSISSKRYRIDKTFLKKIIDGEKVIFKISLENSFVEGRVTDDSRNAGVIFKKFYEKVFEENKNDP